MATGSIQAGNANFVAYDPALTFRAGQAAQQANGSAQSDPWALVQDRAASDQRYDLYRQAAGAPPRAQAPAPTGQAGGSLSEKPIGQMSDEELKRVFGSDADRMKELGAKQPQITPSMIAPLRKDQQGLDSVVKLLSERSDLKFEDLVSRDQKGNVRISSSARDEASRELMLNRTDIKPGELDTMAANFAQQLKQPALAREAYRTSIDLMKTRNDVKPQDLSGLMGRMVKGVGGNTAPGQDSANAGAALDMFKTGAKLMKTRQDIGVDDVGRMSDAVSKLGGKKDDKSGFKIANAFAQGADYLMNKEGSSVNDVVELAGTVRQKMPGESGDDADMRMNLFGQGLNLMKQVPNLKAGDVGNMLTKAAQGPPPRQGQDLVNAFNTTSANLLNGRANQRIATDVNQRQDAEGKQRQDGEILLDKHGKEKGPVESRPTLRADQASTFANPTRIQQDAQETRNHNAGRDGQGQGTGQGTGQGQGGPQDTSGLPGGNDPRNQPSNAVDLINPGGARPGQGGEVGQGGPAGQGNRLPVGA